MKPLLLLLLAARGLQFDVTDARGKQITTVTLEAGAPDADGWQPVKIAKAKGDFVLIWPFDGLAKQPDGPEPVPAIVTQRGDEKSLANKRAMAAMAARELLGVPNETGLSQDSLAKAFAGLPSSADAFEQGVGLLYAGKAAEASEKLAVALRERQRQLTRVPSEIYPLAMLEGLAYFRANKFDDAAVAYLTALKQRPSDDAARMHRTEALVRAGKPEAAGR